MTYSILSNDTRQQLEQERSRLSNDRDAIVASVTAEINQALQYLDALLENGTTATDSISIESNSASTTAKNSHGQGRGTKAGAKPRSPNSDAEPLQEQTGSKLKGERRPEKSFDPKQLKRQFKGMTASDAIVQLMQRDPQQSFAADDAIVELYGNIAAADISRARKSVSAMLMQGVRAGKFEKVQDTPARYKLSSPAAVST